MPNGTCRTSLGGGVNYGRKEEIQGRDSKGTQPGSPEDHPGGHSISRGRRGLSRVRFIEGTVQGLDPVGRTVRFVDENGRSRLLSYEHCVLALGAFAFDPDA